MKLANLIGERFKETPSDCIIESHALMLRGGYMKYVANGIYSSLPPLRRITKKLEQIIREEMDALDGQEVQSSRPPSGRNRDGTNPWAASCCA